MNIDFFGNFLSEGELIEVKNSDGSPSRSELDYLLGDGRKQRVELPDYKYWLSKELWTAREALAISLGLNPTMIKSYVGDVLFHVPGAGLDWFTNELSYRFAALRSSKLMSVESSFTYQTQKTPKEYIDFFSEHYPYSTPMQIWNDRLLAIHIGEASNSGTTGVKNRIERFNFFFNYLLCRFDDVYCENGKVRGTCRHFISAFDQRLKPYLNDAKHEVGYFSSESRIKDLKLALRLKPKKVTQETIADWKASWTRDGITVRPIEFEGGDENPWLATSNKFQ